MSDTFDHELDAYDSLHADLGNPRYDNRDEEIRELNDRLNKIKRENDRIDPAIREAEKIEMKERGERFKIAVEKWRQECLEKEREERFKIAVEKLQQECLKKDGLK